MATSEARKRANAKWAAQHMATFSVKLRADLRDEFKRACAEQGVTANSVMLKAVRDFVAKYGTHEQSE